MTAAAPAGRLDLKAPQALFVATVFASAALVFMVEPMVARLVLPLLGGGPSIWNTSLAFFQTALLAGYAYAHLLQRAGSVRRQVMIHMALVVLAAVVLPLRVHELLGPPTSTHPALWLLGVLAVSVGPPFAVLSATAPLVQAWHARTIGAEGEEPYGLYAASNLGSLIALVAYPALVEPLVTLHAQALGWSFGYATFALLIGSLGFIAQSSARPAAAIVGDSEAEPVTWADRLMWLILAAIPSSLMLGVTTYITTDVASAPFLWVLPLALYLATFIIAFQARPLMSRSRVLPRQAIAVLVCAAMLPFRASPFFVQLPVQLVAFFLTALMCHQALVARRPHAGHLTEFYLWMSAGGVVGGAFNAFAAPVIFSNDWEYPIVLVLAALVRPWGPERTPIWAWAVLAGSVICSALAPVLGTFIPPHLTPQAQIWGLSQANLLIGIVRGLLAAAAIVGFGLRNRALLFFCALAALSMGAQAAADRVDTRHTWRSFFGVLGLSETRADPLGGQVRMLAHGTTLHGAEAVNPRFKCYPLVYYTPITPIGQVLRAEAAAKPSLRIGVTGLGTGSVAAYVRPTDHLTFFEIDPLVIQVATDRRYFRYISDCAKGPVDFVVGDARQTLAKQPRDAFDVLLIDAFSSDAVPTHLLTVEAVKGYLSHLKPDGVLILHLSNRNLDLDGPAQSAAIAAGGSALFQEHEAPNGPLGFWESAEDAVIVGRNPQAIAQFAKDPRWVEANPNFVRPWTDDYVNLIGALWRRSEQRWTWLP
jgi:SAM-dependent methyltransferase